MPLFFSPLQPSVKKAALFFMLAMFSCGAPAQWQTSELDTLKQEFITQIANDYQTTEYPWIFSVDKTECYTTGTDCYFSNPDAIYGHAAFGGALDVATLMRESDALVMLLETPPPMRYFGITPYIYSRYYTAPLEHPHHPGFVQVFQSLTDSINLATIKTQNPYDSFSQLSAVVMTANQKTYQAIYKTLAKLGFPGNAINKIALPLKEVPLRMRYSPYADSFNILIRMAYPDNQAQMDDYTNRTPVRMLKLTATGTPPPLLLPAAASRIPGDGTKEPEALSAGRDQLAQQLLAQYGKDYVIEENEIVLYQTQNYVCVELGIMCNVDSSDALYTRDVNIHTPTSLQDKILIIGVNHVATGKATYMSHSVVNDLYHAGISAVSDEWLNGSALAMAGISDRFDPKYPVYSRLYAFTIGYDCSGEAVCLQIPQPTDDNPIGAALGTPIDVTSRAYLDPATLTRPSSDEVIFHRVFILKKNPAK